MSLNWEDLKVLLAVGRAGSLTAAATQLGLDQSTVGRRLAGLEADLGAILFVRSKTGLTPTQAGDTALERALEVEDRMRRLAEEVGQPNQEVAGLIRIIGNPWTLVRLAGTVLPPLLARHPRLEVRTIGGAVPRSLATAEAAIALWFEIPPRDTEFAVKLGEVPYAIYAPKDVDPGSVPWVSFWDDDAPRRAPSRWIERIRGTREKLTLTATDSMVLREGIRAGVGKGLLPMCLAAGDPMLRRVGEGQPELVRMLHLHAHPDTISTARVQATVAVLRDQFAAAFGPGPAAAQARSGQ